MNHVRKEAAKASNLPVTSYSPIARSLLTMDQSVRSRMAKKFYICYVMAKEGMAFKKFPALHALEERHEVDLGLSYKNAPSAKTFTHYIAKSQCQSFLASFFATSSLYSFLMDGSTDSGNVEDKLVSIQFCVRDYTSNMIRSNTRYLSLCVPTKSDADGLIAYLGEALHVFGVDDVCNRESVLSLQDKPILIGGGTDGAAVNISQQNGIRGKLQRQLLWLQWMWCYSHRLELACKDAFSSQLFSSVDDMLLKLYYLYAKSPEKLRELADVVGLLKEVWEIPDGGHRPLRSQGRGGRTVSRDATFLMSKHLSTV